MVLDLCEALKNFPTLSRELTCKDLMPTQSEYPQTTKTQQLHRQSSLIVYVLSGKRIFVKNQKLWDIGNVTSTFVKKGMHVFEMQENIGWCVMTSLSIDTFLQGLYPRQAENLASAILPKTG